MTHQWIEEMEMTYKQIEDEEQMTDEWIEEYVEKIDECIELEQEITTEFLRRSRK